METNTETITENAKIREDLLKPLRTGEIVEGEIISINKAGVFFDIGVWGTGIIYGKELIEGKEVLRNHGIGDKLQAKVIDLDNEEGFIELSVSKAGKEIAWEELLQKKRNGEIIKVKIQKANKGGLMAAVATIPAFLPVSQLAPEHYPRVPGGETG